MTAVSELSVGQRALAEVWPQLEALGVTEENLRHFTATKDGLATMARLINAAWPGAKSATTPEVAAHIPEGWSVIEDTPSRLIKEVEFIRFLEDGESYVNGEIMRSRAVKLEGNLGIADAVWFLENQALIPTEFRGTAYLVFPGTLLRDSGGNLRVPYLNWVGERWILRFGWMGYGWSAHDRLVRCK